MGVLTAETMTTSSAELMRSLALPKEGMDEVMFCMVEDMVLTALMPDVVVTDISLIAVAGEEREGSK